MSTQKNKIGSSVDAKLQYRCLVVPVASLELSPFLSRFAARAPGAEPPLDELIPEFKAGRQPYVLVAYGSVVLSGATALAAAKAAGVETVEVRECDGCDGLNEADLGLKAAGLHLRARHQLKQSNAFEARMAAMLVYDEWSMGFKRRPPRNTPTDVREEREATRQRLIREAFGKSQRHMIRDRNILNMTVGLREAVAHGRLPSRAIEAAAKLDAREQVAIADQLGRGVPFRSLAKEFFGDDDGRRKTPASAAKRIRTLVHGIVREATGREDCFGLRAEDVPVAQQAVGFLNGWLKVSPPARTLDQRVEQVVADIRGSGRPEPAPTAKRGGRGEAGEPR